MRIPLPEGVQDPRRSFEYSAPRVAPVQSAAGEQQRHLGAVTEHLGLSVMNTANELQHDYDVARVKQAYAALDDAVGKNLDDPENGYLRKIGQDALGGSRKTTADAIEKARDQLSQQLDNPHQREVFGQHAVDLLQSARRRMDDHEGRQLQAFSAGQAKALRDAAAGDIGKAYLAIQEPQRPAGGQAPDAASQALMDQGAVVSGLVKDLQATTAPPVPPGKTEFDRQWQTAVNQARVWAARAGLPPAAQDLAVQGTTSEMHANVVQALIAGKQPDRARQYLEKADKKEIDGQTLTRLDDLVRRGTTADRAARLADGLLTEAPAQQGPQQGPVDYAAQFQAGEQAFLDRTAKAQDAIAAKFRAGEISIEERQQALSFVDQAVHDREQRNQLAAKQTLLEGQKWLSTPGNRNSGVDEMPPDLAQRMDAHGLRTALESFAENGRFSNNGAESAKLRSQSPDWWRSQNAGQFELQYRDKLDDRRMAWALSQIAHYQGAATTEQEKERFVTQSIELAARDLNILPSNGAKPSAQQELAALRFEQNARALMARAPEKGVEPVLQEMKAMRVRQAGRETNPFALSPDEQQTATIRTPDGRDIPLADAVVRDPLTQQIKPFYAQALTEFDAANTERVKQGKAPLSADAAEVVKAWEQHSMMLQAGREQQIRQEVSAAGMRMILPDVRGGWDLAGEQLVAGPDAEKLTGLTSAAIAERLTAMGQAFQEAKPMSRFFSSAPYGFTVRSLALVRASQKK